MFDFDMPVDRSRTGACKWERMTQEERAKGYVPMSVADMEFRVAPPIREAVVRAAEHGLYGYTDPTPEYLSAVLRWMKERHGLVAREEDIVPLTGVVPALCVAVRAFTAPGEGVIAMTPVYPPFYSAAERNGRRLEKCPLVLGEDGYAIDFEALEQCARKDDVKLLLLCSPHNPVGRVWTRAELERIAQICQRHGVIVASDEIHSDLVLEGKHVPFPCVSDWAKEHSVLCVSPSKTFNVPGLQLANVLIADRDLRERFAERAAIDGFSNMPYFGHVAAIAAYTEGGAWLDEAIDYIRENGRVLRAFLGEHFPALTMQRMEGTYLAWVDFRPLGLDEAALNAFLREKAGWIINDGRMFGEEGAGFVRVNLALPRTILEQALGRLRLAAQAE